MVGILWVTGARLGGDAKLRGKVRQAPVIATANAKEHRPCLPHGETLATALAVPSPAECRQP